MKRIQRIRKKSRLLAMPLSRLADWVAMPWRRTAYLATLAIERGYTLCSTDADFARFPDLKWTNPLRP